MLLWLGMNAMQLIIAGAQDQSSQLENTITCSYSEHHGDILNREIRISQSINAIPLIILLIRTKTHLARGFRVGY
jgi:hypothetical protein